LCHVLSPVGYAFYRLIKYFTCQASPDPRSAQAFPKTHDMLIKLAVSGRSGK
jgi:hypothetical protein